MYVKKCVLWGRWGDFLLNYLSITIGQLAVSTCNASNTVISCLLYTPIWSYNVSSTADVVSDPA